MRTLGSHAGYLVIDHRDSPGLTPADVAGLPGAVAVPGGTVLERDVKQCAHCERAVVLHPARVRDRAVCPACYHYICDGCEQARVAAGGGCVPFKRVVDRAQTLVERFAGQPDHPALAVDLVALRAPAAPTVTVTR